MKFKEQRKKNPQSHLSGTSYPCKVVNGLRGVWLRQGMFPPHKWDCILGLAVQSAIYRGPFAVILSRELILSSDFTRSALLINTIISLGIRANGVKMSVGVLVLLMGIGLMGGCGKHLGELCESYLSGKPRTWDCWLRERHTCKVSHMHQPILFPAVCACILNGGCFRKLSHLGDLAFHKSSFLVPNGF